jgi:hypothetical protein
MIKAASAMRGSGMSNAMRQHAYGKHTTVPSRRICDERHQGDIGLGEEGLRGQDLNL